jgi:hypothetical protein
MVVGVACIPGCAQTFDLSTSSGQVASLDGLWRFHPGDDPAWASPTLDDSTWPLLRSDQGWSRQGYKGFSGVAWYRFHVTLPPDLKDISLSLPQFWSSYEIYANGRRIGGIGKMPPNPELMGPQLGFDYPIPRDTIPGRDLTIAIRVWHWKVLARGLSGGPQSSDAWIGESTRIRRLNREARSAFQLGHAGPFILGLLQTLGAVAALGLFLLRRSDREYLWFALILAFSAASSWSVLALAFAPWSQILSNRLIDLFKYALAPLAQLAFYSRLLQVRRSWFYWGACAALVLSAILGFVVDRARIGPYVWNGLAAILILPAYLWILSALFRQAWRNVADARILLLPAVLQVAATLFEQWSWITFYLGITASVINASMIRWVFPISFELLAELLFLHAVLGILIYRFARTRGEHERYASEIDAARSVQQYLIPEHLPQTPGFAIESAYIPAREVGGDFFQVLPQPCDGCVLICIGDVAGKGLHAGMLAALIVGAVRTAATFTSNPTEILSLLNQRLQGRGLVTCLALAIKNDGCADLVNAGHLPPYLNGKELCMEGALPLGALPGAEFPVLRFQLAPGDSLALMSDGIVEAQSADGALFGFDRIAAMLNDHATAASLAAAAQRFGQADDITVLTVARAATATS